MDTCPCPFSSCPQQAANLQKAGALHFPLLVTQSYDTPHSPGLGPLAYNIVYILIYVMRLWGRVDPNFGGCNAYKFLDLTLRNPNLVILELDQKM